MERTELNANRIEREARKSIIDYVVNYIYKIYDATHDENTNFENDEEYEIPLTFSYMVDVTDTHTTEYYQEKRVADKIIMSLDQSVYVNNADDCGEEMLAIDLKFEDLVDLCNLLEINYNKLNKEE